MFCFWVLIGSSWPQKCPKSGSTQDAICQIGSGWTQGSIIWVKFGSGRLVGFIWLHEFKDFLGVLEVTALPQVGKGLTNLPKICGISDSSGPPVFGITEEYTKFLYEGNRGKPRYPSHPWNKQTSFCNSPLIHRLLHLCKGHRGYLITEACSSHADHPLSTEV